jgi:hypothetical protein
MRRFVVGLFMVASLVCAQVQVFEPEVFTFSTDMGDASVSPTGIINELRERYKTKGIDLGEADARLVPLEITVTSGMGSLELDLTGLNVSALEVTSDLGNIGIILSELGMTSGSLTTGMGNISLQLPSSRSLAVVESVTGMGDIRIDSAVNQSGTESAVTLDLTTDRGEIVIAPVGAVLQDEEEMGEEEGMEETTSEVMEETDTTMATDTTTVTDTTVNVAGVASVTTVDGVEEVDASGNITVTEVSFSDEVMTIDGMGGEQTFDCAGKEVVVNGTQIALTLTGVCDTIEINGATNTVTVDAVRSLVINGLGNKVTYLYTLNNVEPTAELVGLNNTVERKQ